MMGGDEGGATQAGRGFGLPMRWVKWIGAPKGKRRYCTPMGAKTGRLRGKHDGRRNRMIILASDHNHGVFLPIDLNKPVTLESLVKHIRPLTAIA